jgi:hypothetical protein
VSAQETLPGDDFEPMTKGGADVEQGEYEEKVAFPSTHAPVPTWHAAYGNESAPGFAPGYRSPSETSPSETLASTRLPSPADSIALRLPSPAVTRAPALGSPADAAPLGRHGSIASQRSVSSVASSGSFGKKRWVIE